MLHVEYVLYYFHLHCDNDSEVVIITHTSLDWLAAGCWRCLDLYRQVTVPAAGDAIRSCAERCRDLDFLCRAAYSYWLRMPHYQCSFPDYTFTPVLLLLMFATQKLQCIEVENPVCEVVSDIFHERCCLWQRADMVKYLDVVVIPDAVPAGARESPGMPMPHFALSQHF